METAVETFGKQSQDIIQGEIRFRPSTHEYFHSPTNKKLTPVSRVIETVYSAKSWDGVKPEVVENARDRGIAVDRYMAEYIRTSLIRIEPDESPEVRDRVIAAHRIWEEEFSGLPAVSQKIVYSLQDGIAGTMDFWVDQSIVVDLKCTYKPEKAWILQLGAYANYCQEPPRRMGVIHVTKDGGTWIEYNVMSCAAYWRQGVSWWRTTNEMKR
jgi:hypothetical protein